MRKILVTILATCALSACASTQYDAAEVCSADWIKPRAADALTELIDDTEGAVKSMRKVSTKYMEGKTPGPLQMFALSNSLKSLEKELTKGQGIKDLKILAKTCNDPQIVTDGMKAFVENLGLPQRISAFIEALPRYQELLAAQLRDI